MRVGAAQFKTGSNVEENLQTCLRMIDQAGKLKVDLVVFPEFCNALSWYDNSEDAKRLAVTLEGDFIRKIGEKVKQNALYLVISVSLLENDNIFVSSLVFNRQGKIVNRADKQAMMGHENDYFTKAFTRNTVIAPNDLDGVVGNYQCRDGVCFETPRGLVLDGAQVNCCSLNSFAFDEAELHIPARAAENKVFVVAANKVGPLIPEEQLETVGHLTKIPVKFLYGAGESQIISPDGVAIVKATKDQEQVIYADIDPKLALNKLRPDGTDIVLSRRPEIYGILNQPPNPASLTRLPAVDQISIAVYHHHHHHHHHHKHHQQQEQEHPHKHHQNHENQHQEHTPPAVLEDILKAIKSAAAQQSDILVLPELVTQDLHTIGHRLEEAAVQGVSLVAKIIEELHTIETALHVAVTVVEINSENKVSHVGKMIAKRGVVFEQKQTHNCGMYPWVNDLGSDIVVEALSFGNVAMIVGQDVIFPETSKIAAIKDADILVVMTKILEEWETRLCLPSRAAENRVCLIASSSSHKSGIIADLEREFTILTEWKERQWDGNINKPIITPVEAGKSHDAITFAMIHPGAAFNKVMSKNTDLIQGRPWKLGDRILSQK